MRFAKKVEKALPSEIRLLSLCEKANTSVDNVNVGAFQVPNSGGKGSGTLISALLQVLYRDHVVTSEKISWDDMLRRMRQILEGVGCDRIPQLTSSRQLDVKKPMNIVPRNCTGTKRAALIGINYVGEKGALSGCHDDVGNVKEFLMKVHGFKEANMTILMDKKGHPYHPTRRNILTSLRRLVALSRPGDTVFVQFSGHVGRMSKSKKSERGYHETLIPSDFRTAGQISDVELYKEFMGAMSAGVTVTFVMDCCQSGTVLNLPYRYAPDDKKPKMYQNEAFDIAGILGLAIVGGIAGGVIFDECSGDSGCMEFFSALFE